MRRQFASPAAFRASIEDRLRKYAGSAGVQAQAVRKQAALERLMARLMEVAADRWALKGGLALDTRLGARARTSMDMDMDHAHGVDAAIEDLRRATAADLDDNFSFAIVDMREIREAGLNLAIRLRVECSVAGALFELLQVDVSVLAPEVWDAEPAVRPGLLAGVGLGPIEVRVISIERHTAEKFHAYTRTYRGGQRSTRARDLVDLVLIRTLECPNAGRLGGEIDRTFKVRATHDVPTEVPPPPTEWAIPYREEAGPVRITTDLDTAHRLVAEMLDPVLSGAGRGTWDPERTAWMG